MAEEILRVENLHVKVEDTPILNGMNDHPPRRNSCHHGP